MQLLKVHWRDLNDAMDRHIDDLACLADDYAALRFRGLLGPRGEGNRHGTERDSLDLMKRDAGAKERLGR